MIKIAITGKIGTGKTTVSKTLKSMGYQVFESDIEVKKFYKESKLIENLEPKLLVLVLVHSLDLKSLIQLKIHQVFSFQKLLKEMI